MNIAIIGGGMSGIVAAITASKNKNNNITIYERQKDIASKILITGNGKCNICNSRVSEKGHYSSFETDRLDTLSMNFDPKKLIDFFKGLGLSLKERDGYYYPVSNQARSVYAVLSNAIKKASVKVITDKYIDRIAVNPEGYTIDGKNYDAVVLAVGGRAGIYKENAFSGRELIKSLDLKSSRTFPALTGAVCVGDYKTLKGVRVDASIKLYADDKFVAEDTGELQFADYGLSGIPVFNLSSHVPYDYKEAYFEVDLFPENTEEELKNMLSDIKAMYPKYRAINVLAGFTNINILKYALSMTGIHEDKLMENVADKDLDSLALWCKKSKHPMERLRDYKNAQIMTGGILLSEIDDNYMCIHHKNLYITGEALDLNGECGGYNLYFAFESGYEVGQKLAK